MAEIPIPDGTPQGKSRILSIDVRITYCHSNGKKREMVVDTSQVRGITWDLAAHDSQLPDKNGVDRDPKNRLRFKMKSTDLGGCGDEEEESQMQVRSLSLVDEAVCCWWDGVRWICPDEVE